mgnify:CR=1 FL=1
MRSPLFKPFKPLLLAVAGLAMFSGQAQSSNDDFVEMVGATDITWQLTTKLDYYQLVLNVSGPNEFSYQNEFVNSPYLQGPLEDGLYKYEIYVMPYGQASAAASSRRGGPVTTGDEGAIDANGRPAGNRFAETPASESRSQSGTFAIAGGLFVDPTLSEE